MATKKAKEVRPSLTEVKAQAGRLVVAEYRGVETGSFSIPASKLNWPGANLPEDLLILQYQPRVIGDYWLDNPWFESLYNQHEDIFVWRTDDPPKDIDWSVPDKISRVLRPGTWQRAQQFALSPYGNVQDPRKIGLGSAMRDLVFPELQNAGETEQFDFQKKQVLPWLRLLKVYEQRVQKRTQVLKDIDAQIEKIENLKEYEEA